MNVMLISDTGLQTREPEELEDLLDHKEELIWVDIPVCDESAVHVLRDVFGFHSIAVHDCVERNHISKVHVYPDHVFTVLHAPQLGRRGHVHYVELDQFVGRNYLVTVHGPLNPALEIEVALRDTKAVIRRIEQHHLHVRSPFELSYAVVTAMTHREADLVARLAQESGRLEQRVMLEDELQDPEAFIEDLFQVWYELLTIRTLAAHSSATYSRVAKIDQRLPEHALPLILDTVQQFDLVKGLADGQREFLHGVIEFYQTRTSTHMTIAAEQSAATGVQQNDDMRKITAWVAIVAVPTAVTGFFGQNIPYPGFGEQAGFIASTTIMILIALVLYLIFRHKRWL
jgi:Mg2+ and Co2+ transporter CorA